MLLRIVGLLWGLMLSAAVPASEPLYWHRGDSLNEAGRVLHDLLLPEPAAFAALGPAGRDAWLTREWRRVLAGRERFAQYTLPAHWRAPAFEQALREGRQAGYLAGQVPDYEGYRQLHRHYRQLGERPEPAPLPPGPEVRPGERDAAIPALRRRLAELGRPGPAPAGRADALDPALSAELRALQQAAGLPEHGRLDAATRALLDRPPGALRAELRANLRRWLLLPPASRDYVLVNIPSYRLTLVRQGRPSLAMKVIVGRPDWPTPELATHIHALKVNPDWTPTANIVREDLLPAERRSPGFLARNGFSARLDQGELSPSAIDWSAPPPGVRLVQAPGPGNALGRLKFEMHNRFDVYLHDTPDKALFAEPMRALSHGCVRLAEPARLARGLGWQPGEGQATRLLPAPERLPVYLVYFTAWVEQGRLVFARDIYRKNERETG